MVQGSKASRCSTFCTIYNSTGLQQVQNLTCSKVAGVQHWPSSTEASERAQTYFYSSSVPSWHVTGWTLLYFNVYILQLPISSLHLILSEWHNKPQTKHYTYNAIQTHVACNNQCHKFYHQTEWTYTSNENVQSTLAIHFTIKAIGYAKMKFLFIKAIMTYTAPPLPQNISTDTHTHTHTHSYLRLGDDT
jgi:hypothetical protein